MREEITDRVAIDTGVESRNFGNTAGELPLKGIDIHPFRTRGRRWRAASTAYVVIYKVYQGEENEFVAWNRDRTCYGSAPGRIECSSEEEDWTNIAEF